MAPPFLKRQNFGNHIRIIDPLPTDHSGHLTAKTSGEPPKKWKVALKARL